MFTLGYFGQQTISRVIFFKIRSPKTAQMYIKIHRYICKHCKPLYETKDLPKLKSLSHFGKPLEYNVSRYGTMKLQNKSTCRVITPSINVVSGCQRMSKDASYFLTYSKIRGIVNNNILHSYSNCPLVLLTAA